MQRHLNQMVPSALADCLRENCEARYRRRIDEGYCRFVGVKDGAYLIEVTDWPLDKERKTMLALTERRSAEGVITFRVGEEKIISLPDK